MATQRTTQIQPTTINDPVNLPDPVVNFLLVGFMVLPLAIMSLKNLKNLGGKSQ